MKKKILIGFTSIIVGILGGYIAWLQQSVELKPEVVDILKLVPAYNPHSQQSAFFFVNGFDALPEVDPVTLGKKSYDLDWKFYIENPDTKENSQNSVELQKQRIESKTFWSKDDRKLIDQIKEHVNSADYSSTQFWSENKTAIESLFQEKKFLIERYEKEIDHKNYQVLIQAPNSNSPLNLYHDTHILFLARLYLQGNLKEVHDYVLKRLGRLNQNFNTIDRAILIVQLNQSIDVLNFLTQRNNQYIQLPVLNATQLSFEKQATYEMRYAYNIFEGADHRFDYTRNETHGLTKLWGKISVPFAFNFNQSINQAYSNFEPYIKVSKLPYSQFAAQINNVELPKQHKWALRNNIGNILNQIGGTAWDKEILRPRLLDNKIQIFNIINSGRNIGEQISEKSEEGYVFTQSKNELCIQNPYKNIEELNERLQGDSCIYINK